MACSPEIILKNDAIRCGLMYILIRFCLEELPIIYVKNNYYSYTLLIRVIFLPRHIETLSQITIDAFRCIV